MIDIDELYEKKECPFCGNKGNLEPGNSYVVIFSCEACGFLYKFINPVDGFNELDFKDATNLEDKILQAEKDALENCYVKNIIPSKDAIEGSKCVIFFSQLDKRCKDWIDDIFQYDSRCYWREGKKQAVQFLIRNTFNEI